MLQKPEAPGDFAERPSMQGQAGEALQPIDACGQLFDDGADAVQHVRLFYGRQALPGSRRRRWRGRRHAGRGGVVRAVATQAAAARAAPLLAHSPGAERRLWRAGRCSRAHT